MEKELELYRANPIKERERDKKKEKGGKKGGRKGEREREEDQTVIIKEALFIQSMYLRQFFSNERMIYYLLSRFVGRRH